MRYSVLADGQSIDDLAFFSDLATAKQHGAKLANEKPDVEVCIDGYPEIAGPMLSWRFDRDISAWVGR